MCRQCMWDPIKVNQFIYLKRTQGNFEYQMLVLKSVLLLVSQEKSRDL